MAEAQKPKVVDNPSIAESYANKLVAASFDGATVVITLGTARFVPGQDAAPTEGQAAAPIHVTARLALSPSAAVELGNAIGAMLKTLSEMKQKAAGAKSPEPN